MKNPRQYRDSAMFAFIGYVGIIIVVVALLLGLGESNGFNKEVQEGLQNDPRPKSPLWNYTHPNLWDQGECGDTLTPQDSLELLEPDAIYYDTLDIDGDCGGSDEYRMWIGSDGDTIWE